MTHDPDQEHSTPQADPDWEVLTGPGGAEPERTPGSSVRELWQRRSARGRAVLAAATVVVLALGGTVAYAATSGRSGSEGATAASSSSPSPGAPGGRPGFGGPGFGLGGEAVHGEATVKDGDTGKWVVRVWQRGTVEKVDGDQVTVKSDDGTQWTWTVSSDATVRGSGDSDSGAAAPKKGETAYLVGSRSESGTLTATQVRSGSLDDKGPGGRRGGFPGRGPGDRGDRAPSPGPSGSGATT